ncbi:MAG: ribose-5-phosphate isomerase RpiA [Spirochaetales bacterium]|nr:ribose-5-phosphate isomerase RpiA [Spirochaetales bacterium]
MEASELKKLVGLKAADDLVVSGLKLGLGTGSTAIEAVRRIGERFNSGELKDIEVVATSFDTKLECHKYGLNVYMLNDPIINGRLDLTIDGADEVDPNWNLVKGGGGALLVEKIIGYVSSRYCIIVDESKLVDNLGEKMPVPLEVIPEALVTVEHALISLGGEPRVRMAKMKAGPVNTERGNIIVDCYLKGFNPEKMEKELNEIPGIVENGIFSHGVTDLYTVYSDGHIKQETR